MPEVCLLNRKPYRDRWGSVRVRPQRYCCKQAPLHACQLQKHPEGDLKKTGGPIKRRKPQQEKK